MMIALGWSASIPFICIGLLEPDTSNVDDPEAFTASITYWTLNPISNPGAPDVN